MATGSDSNYHEHNEEIEKLSSLLDNIFKDELATKRAVEIILSKQTFKNTISEALVEKVTQLEAQVENLTTRMDDMEQYSRRTCLKFTGIPENKDENTDQMILNVINNYVLDTEDEKMDLYQISRSHRVGRPPNNDNRQDQGKGQRPRDIIVKFVSYRDRALIYAKKSNLKPFNENEQNNYKIFVNEALTKKRAELLFQTRLLVKNKALEQAWTYDGNILAKTLAGKIITLRSFDDLLKF
ncbi:uncharacterized protein LOC134268329 [Saccostrea cucullata]|uniref:uncharacterized protein LOC134268329 n=1 Tax=Saccostrea cuccullata TaxID=36930 RepID=UPI002ED63175